MKHVVPSDYRLAMAALNNRGRPLVLDNHSRLAAAYDGLGDRPPAGSRSNEPRSRHPASIFGRLTGRGLGAL